MEIEIDNWNLIKKLNQIIEMLIGINNNCQQFTIELYVELKLTQTT